MSRKALVTGGAGFLGSHLCESLIKDDYYVFCVDNLHTGRVENIKELETLPNFEFYVGDVTEKMFTQVRVDEIYNLACPASPIHYQNDPIATVKTNVLGAINVLELAKSQNAKVLQASTSEVYGDPDIHPQVESYWGHTNPIGPRACYDEGKRCAETLFFDYYRKYGVDIRVIRIFNTYGPNMAMNDGRVVSNFICQCLKEDPITIYGDGSQTRSFCYVTDLIRGIRLMMEQESTVGPVNLGNPQEITILELVIIITKIIGWRTKIEYKTLPINDPTRRKPNIQKAKENLGWLPVISLEDGIHKTVNYFRKELGIWI